MIDHATLHRILFAALFVVLAGFVVFVRLLPLGGGPGALPAPDLILLIGFAWVVRRPDFVPVLLFALVLLVTDFLFQRPPGLRTAAAVVGLEVLRGRVGLLRQQPFAMEWGTVVMVLGLMLVGERMLMALFFVPQVSLGLSILETVVNAGFYPVVVLVSLWALGVRRLQPGEHVAEARIT